MLAFKHEVLTYTVHNDNRIEKAKQEDVQVCDVDGSYLFRKQQRAVEAGIAVFPTTIPILGWERLSTDNQEDISSKIPSVMPGIRNLNLVS